MRNICNIDFINRNNDSVANTANDSNEILAYILPLENQKTNLKIEIIGSNNETFTSEVLILEAGESLTLVDYLIDKKYWSNAGTMKIRLLSNEGNSDYCEFVCIDCSDNDDIYCKYDILSNQFYLLKNINNDTDLPIASETQLGVVQIGATLNITPEGLLNANDGEGVEPILNIELDKILV